MHNQNKTKNEAYVDLQHITLSDIIDIADIQRFQDIFANTHGVASLITNIDGTPITQPSNFTRLCKNIIRQTEKGCANCFHSDAVIGNFNSKGPNVQRCLSGGLWDAGVSISVGGKHIANWLIGQIRNDHVDIDTMMQYADEIGVDRAEFKAAFDEVPVMSKEQFHNIADLLFFYANELSDKAYRNLQLKKQLEENERINILLLEREENLKTTLQSIGDGVISTDKNGYIVNMNPIAEHLCGWKLSEARGVPLPLVFNIINADTRKSVADPVKKVIQSGRIIGLANHTILKSNDGNEYQISDSAAPIKNKEGEIIGVILVFSDVTEKYEAQKLIHDDKVRFSSLLENLETGIVVHAPDTSIIRSNPKAWEILGLSDDQIRGKKAIDPAWSFIAEDNKKLPIEQYPVNQIASSQKPIRGQIYGIYQPEKKSTIWVSVNGFPVFDNKGNISEIVVSFIDITERINAEKELIESKMKYQTLFETSNDINLIISDGVFVDCNNAALTLFDCERDQIIGSSPVKFSPKIQPNGHTSEEDANKRITLALEGESQFFEWEHCRLDGTVFASEVRLHAVSIGGKPHLQVIIRNVSEYKRSEQTISMLAHAIRSISECVSITDMEDKIIFVNNAFVNTYQYNENELIGKNISIIRSPNNPVDIVSQVLPATIQGGWHGELLNKKKDGTEFPISISTSVIKDDVGNPVALIGITNDITERKKVELKLRESNELFAKFMSHSPFYTFIKEVSPTESIVLQASENFQQMIGISGTEMIGKPMKELFPIDLANKIIADDWDCYNNNKVLNLDEELNGRYYSTTKFPIQHHEKALLAGYTIDVTERKIVEQLLKEKNEEIVAQNKVLFQTNEELIIAKEKAQESDRLKSAFLANMSHEIRTPMNGILGFSELLKEPGLSGDEQLAYIDIIEKSGTRLLNIINDIVDISKIEAGLMKLNIQESNINEQIKYIYTFFKPEVEAKKISFSYKNGLQDEAAYIKIDREKVYAILTNLVKNSIKFTEKGKIEFGYSLKTNQKLPILEFYVKDSGIGIPKERQTAVFERFIQADIADKMARQGTGLGLAISKAYVEMLGGKIWVESEEGVGSTFFFMLPY